jgi:hypothetical protein
LKNHVVKGNFEIIPLLLGLESEERYRQISDLNWKPQICEVQ